MWRMASSSGAESSGGANEIMGTSRGWAPRSRNAAIRGALCSAARVITTRFPSSGLRCASATGTVHLIQDGSSAAFHEQASYMVAQFGGLVGRGAGTMTNVLLTVHGTDDCLHHQFSALQARPGSHGHLA